MAKGFSEFNDEGTSNRNNVQVMAMQDEINETEETNEVNTDEFDHRSDEEKNAEGYKSIIDEWKSSKEDKQDEPEVEETTDTGETDDDSSESKDEPKTEEPKEEKQAGDELPVIPKVLIDSALEVGITSEEIQKMSIGDLTKSVEALTSLPKEEAKEEEKEPEVDPLDELALDPDEYDESIVKVVDTLKDIVKNVRDENKALKEKQEAREQEIAEQNAIVAEQSLINEFDDVLKDIDNKALFGEGDAFSIDTKSKEFDNRAKLFDDVKALGGYYYKTGKPVPAMAELIKTVGLTMFGDTFNNKEQVSKKLEERSSNLLGKPSPRNSIEKSEPEDGSKESRLDNAVSAVKGFFKEKGLNK